MVSNVEMDDDVMLPKAEVKGEVVVKDEEPQDRKLSSAQLMNSMMAQLMIGYTQQSMMGYNQLMGMGYNHYDVMSGAMATNTPFPGLYGMNASMSTRNDSAINVMLQKIVSEMKEMKKKLQNKIAPS